MRQSSLVLVALLLLFGLMTPAHAQEIGSRDLETPAMRQAVQLYSEGKFRSALSMLETIWNRAATEAEDRAQIQLYIGLCQAALGNSPIEAFGRAVQEDAQVELDAAQHHPRIVNAFRSVQRKLTGVLKLDGPTDSAVIRIDGIQRVPPLTQRFLVGEHLIEAAIPGDDSYFSRQIRVDAGDVIEIRVPKPTPRAKGVSEAVPVTLEGAGARPNRSAAASGRFWTWVTGGAAIAAAGVAAGFSVVAVNDKNAADSLFDAVEAGEQPAEPNRHRYEQLQDDVSTNQTIANVSWGIAGALAITSLILFFVERDSSETLGNASRATATNPVAAQWTVSPVFGPTVGVTIGMP